MPDHPPPTQKSMLLLTDCLKKYTADLDKACSPDQTVARVLAIFGNQQGVLEEAKRIDTGRLDIPVYLSRCGPRATAVMPTRKQMGKGSTPDQAQASALMELVERFSFFSYWADEANFIRLTWSEAQKAFGESLMPVEEILASVSDSLPPEEAVRVLDLVPWRFAKALHLGTERERILPVDWFKKLNEFNGSSAGNTFEEAILQGACELIERHVCALVDRKRPLLPSLDPDTFADETLQTLWQCFTRQGIRVVLKDFSFGFPVPTVGALAYDPANFPGLSEIVFTAGTATSPAKAAVRALTEIAQLAGDFETGSNYEASGLPKFTSLHEAKWILEGESVPLDSLPSLEHANMLRELRELSEKLQDAGLPLYSVDITHPDLAIPSCYSIVPGFLFRERAANQSLGMFVGRMLAEEYPPDQAMQGLDVIAKSYPEAHFIPFFRGMVHLRTGNNAWAREEFLLSLPLSQDREEQALAAFYTGYSHAGEENWTEALRFLDQAIELDPQVHEYYNLRGVARFKRGSFEQAADDFKQALILNGGSALDYANLGMCSKELGRRSAAADYFQLALEIDPEQTIAKNGLQELAQSST